MKTYTLNIGLLVGDSEPTDQLTKILHYTTKLPNTFIKHLNIVEGFYLNRKERTLVINLVTSLNKMAMSLLIEDICVSFNQDCVASYSEDFNQGTLHYNRNYKGDKQQFNHLYFIHM